MTFSENLNRICKERGTTVSTILKEMGISTSKVTMWNNGSIPKQEMLIKLAHALDCSVMDFFQDSVDTQIHESGYILLDEDEKEVIRMFRELTLKDKHKFMAKAYSYEETILHKGE